MKDQENNKYLSDGIYNVNGSDMKVSIVFNPDRYVARLMVDSIIIAK